MLTSGRDEILQCTTSWEIKTLAKAVFSGRHGVRIHFMCTDAEVHGTQQQAAVRGKEKNGGGNEREL